MLPTIPFWGLMLWSIAFEMEKDRDMEKKQKMKESCDVNKQPLLHINLMQKRRYNMNTVQRKKEEREEERERD